MFMDVWWAELMLLWWVYHQLQLHNWFKIHVLIVWSLCIIISHLCNHSNSGSSYISGHWSMVASHYLNQWWFGFWRIYASLSLNELSWLALGFIWAICSWMELGIYINGHHHGVERPVVNSLLCVILCWLSHLYFSGICQYREKEGVTVDLVNDLVEYLLLELKPIML